MIQAAFAGAERIFDVLDQKSEYEGEGGKLAMHDIRGDVDFAGVNFSYLAGQPVLRDVNLVARPGKSIALVGPTGAGKTTILTVLLRFYEVETGEILIDGQNIKAFTKDSLRRQVGIVLQDTYLFSASVRDNIRYGRLDASDAEIEAAAVMAEADPFIRRLGHGYDTVLNDDGSNLSQGQRQLPAIARAILANPAILILDEATSSVDTRTELHIQRAMIKLMEGRTSFVIAHRLSTIRDAAENLVIDGGAIRLGLKDR